MHRATWILAALTGLIAGTGLVNLQRADRGARVKEARATKGDLVRSLVKRAGLAYPPKSLYIRAFKTEKQLEVWASSGARKPHTLIKTYSIAAMSGDIGPKRKQGDFQVPEGFYTIDRFNPRSSFHLSLGLNYPNKSDRILSDKERPGADIFIHGNSVSAGCMAMTDDKIKEIYVLALDAKSAGARQIHVHIFPCRMDVGKLAALKRAHNNVDLHTFWDSLKPAYDHFGKTKLIPSARVLASGRYLVRPG